MMPPQHQIYISVLQAEHDEMKGRGIGDEEIQIALRKRYDALTADAGGSTEPGPPHAVDEAANTVKPLTFTIHFCEN